MTMAAAPTLSLLDGAARADSDPTDAASMRGEDVRRGNRDVPGKQRIPCAVARLAGILVFYAVTSTFSFFR